MLKDVKTNEKQANDDMDDDELEEAVCMRCVVVCPADLSVQLMQARERETENYEQRAKVKKGKGKVRFTRAPALRECVYRGAGEGYRGR